MDSLLKQAILIGVWENQIETDEDERMLKNACNAGILVSKLINIGNKKYRRFYAGVSWWIIN